MRRTAIFTLLALSSLTVRAAADGEVTLDLPSTSSASTAAQAAQTPKTPPAAKKPPVNRRASANSAIAMKKFGSRGGQVVNGTKQYTVGRLAIATGLVPIRVGRGSGKPVLSKVQPGTYVALNCENGSWYGVLMADRTTGWIQKSDVKMLDYEVVSNRKADSAEFTASNPAGLGSGVQLLMGSPDPILRAARAFFGVGIPYKWGGTTANGIDCSAFVQRCFASAGVGLPRTAREQANYGTAIARDQLQPGDRLYFANSGGDIVHTGIYIGDDQFIHSSSLHHGIAISRLTEDLYTRMYAGARR